MIASFILSRTLVPTMAMYLLRPHAAHEATRAATRGTAQSARRGSSAASRAASTSCASVYRDLLERGAWTHRRPFLIGFMVFVVLSFGLAPFLGSNFFPSVDAGQMTLHVRAPVGTRLEDTPPCSTASRADPPGRSRPTRWRLGGRQHRPCRSAASTWPTATPADRARWTATSMSRLKPRHHPTADYVTQPARDPARASFPGSTFAFLPADIISQILNFGSPAPHRPAGQPARTAPPTSAYMPDRCCRRLRAIPGIADVRMQQSARYPELRRRRRPHAGRRSSA